MISNRQPAPPPSYQEDASLKPGQIKQVDWAKEGMDAVVTRTIRYGDGKVKQEKLVSKYRPWQAIYLYGPGTNVPGKTSAGNAVRLVDLQRTRPPRIRFRSCRRNLGGLLW